MNNNSQLSAANSNCEMFNFSKNSRQMHGQGESSNYNSQKLNPNENAYNSNNNQNFMFQIQSENENDYNPENLLFQFNNADCNNNARTQSQRSSNSNFFCSSVNNNNNNQDFLNYSQYNNYHNQKFEHQENNFNFTAASSDNKWNTSQNNSSSQLQAENKLSRINDIYNNNNNTINFSRNNLNNGYFQTSSRASTKSNKSLSGYFNNNNTNKSPKHVLDALKIINEAVENENNDDFGFLLHNQQPSAEKNNLNNQNQYAAYENQFFLLNDNNKSVKEESVITHNNINNNNNNLDSRQQATNLGYNKSTDITNLPIYNPNNHQSKADKNNNNNNILFRNKNNQIDLFASGAAANKSNKYHNEIVSVTQNIDNSKVNESENNQNDKNKNNFIKFKPDPTKKENNNLKATEPASEENSFNLYKNNFQDQSEELKNVKNIEIQKLNDDFDTLENDLFSTLTFKKRNFFDFGNPQSEEIMERIRLADIEELSKLLDYKGKEFKPDESDFHSVVHKPHMKMIKMNMNNQGQGIKNTTATASEEININNVNYSENNKKEIANVIKEEEEFALSNCTDKEANKMKTGKTIEANNSSNSNHHLQLFDLQQLPAKEARRSINNLSHIPAIINRNDNTISIPQGKHFGPIDDKIQQQQKLSNQELNIKFDKMDNTSNLIKIKENTLNKENTPLSVSDNNRVIIENPKLPATASLDSSTNTLCLIDNINHTRKIGQDNQLQKLKILKEREINNKKNNYNNYTENNNNKSEKIQKEEKLNKFQFRPKKTTFSLDQVTVPCIESLRESQKVYDYNFSCAFPSISDLEGDEIASSLTLASLSKAFEEKKSLVNYVNDIMENFSKLYLAVENSKYKLKKNWDKYILSYLMDVEYYNYICEMIEENLKFDIDKIESNVIKIAQKYQNDD